MPTSVTAVQVGLFELWLPIVLSAIVAFIASSIIHMVLPYHRSDYKKLPNEENVLAALRQEGIAPGDYGFPRAASMKDMGSSEMLEKYKKGPVGMMTILPSGPPAMGKSLGLWFAYLLVVSFLLAYVGHVVLPAGEGYRMVFRVIGTTGFMVYGVATAVDSIWKGQVWSTTIKHMIDGLIYALLTAGIFGWLWPSADLPV